MARYRKIDTRIWNDNKFNQLSDDSKLLFFFLLTHPHLTAIGAMRISLLGLAGELNWLEERLRQALAEPLAKGMVKVDEKACFVWLPNFLKYNQPESPNVVKSWEQSLDYLPECHLKNALIYHVQCLVERLSEGFREALPEAFRKGMPNQEQEQEHKQEQEQKNNITRRSDENVNDKKSLKITDDEPVAMITSPSYNHAEQAQCHMESLSGGFKEALPEAFRKGMPNQEQEQEHKQEQEQKNTTRQSVTNFYTEIISEKIANENQVVVIKIPLVGNTEFVVTPSMVEQWQTLYPAVDIIQELRNLCGWNLANPQRRKTKTGIVKHINTWLAKKQNAGGNYATSYTTRSPPLTPSNTLYGFNIAIGEQWAEENTKIIEGELANDQ